MALEQELPLISTIAIGLSFAFICGFIASKLRISSVVGYLVAGIIIGPHTPGYVASPEIAHELSEIGIVLLMFGVGLHFSFSDLMKVRNIAITGAVIQMLFTALVGIGLARYWGWPVDGAILYGLALSVASTVVLLRALEQQKAQHSTEGHIAIGWLIVEDLIMIMALVLVPVLAKLGNGIQGAEATTAVLLAIGKALLFAVVMGVIGRKVFPVILAQVNKTGSRELFTLSVLVAAIGVAFGAAKLFDVSLALGAFFAGMVINSSKLNEEVAARALPFQDAFAVLFFVAIGMLFNPSVLIDNPTGVAATAFIIVILKFILSFFIVLSFSFPIRSAVTISSSLAQIGEFSFILIGMGLTLGMLPDAGRDLVLAGAFISIAINPIIHHLAHRIFSRVEDKTLIPLGMQEPKMKSSPKANNKRAVLIGFGILGEQIISDTNNANLEFTIIDTNREKVSDLQKKNIEVISGDAGATETLRQAGIEHAYVAIIIIPDPYDTCRIVNAIREQNPEIQIMVNATNEEEAIFYEGKNIDTILLGRREIGRNVISFLNNLKI
ncbi:MAG: sodium:proton antiporter [Alphaproteobacteria bacterium]|nr:sodium:proton antiporter [Alphaproteobacteria bacterium]|tara:strand:+ start:1931 stop:3589 length:1659 start_codon:yes stop_codon:yes gene_type:complete